MTSSVSVPYYYITGSILPGCRTLVHVWADGEITTMPYDESVSVSDAIERMQQLEGIYKHLAAPTTQIVKRKVEEI